MYPAGTYRHDWSDGLARPRGMTLACAPPILGSRFGAHGSVGTQPRRNSRLDKSNTQPGEAQTSKQRLISETPITPLMHPVPRPVPKVGVDKAAPRTGSD